MGNVEDYKNKLLYLLFIHHLLSPDEELWKETNNDQLKMIKENLIRNNRISLTQKNVIDSLSEESKKVMIWRHNNVPSEFAKKAHDMFPDDPFMIINRFEPVEFGWLNEQMYFILRTNAYLPYDTLVYKFDRDGHVRYAFFSNDHLALINAVRFTIEVLNIQKMYSQIQDNDPISKIDKNISTLKMNYGALWQDCIRNATSGVMALSSFVEIFLTNLYEEICIHNKNTSIKKIKKFTKLGITDKIIHVFSNSKDTNANCYFKEYEKIINTDGDKNARNEKLRKLRDKFITQYRAVDTFYEEVYSIRNDLIHKFPLNNVDNVIKLDMSRIDKFILGKLDLTLGLAKMIWSKAGFDSCNGIIEDVPQYLFGLSRKKLVQKANADFLRSKDAERILWWYHMKNITKEVENDLLK